MLTGPADIVLTLLAYISDIGLPPGQTRDDVWNANNYAEAGFKVFDAFFLECRRCKRYYIQFIELILYSADCSGLLMQD